MKYRTNLSLLSILFVLFFLFVLSCGSNRGEGKKDIVTEPGKMNERVEDNIQQVLEFAESNNSKTDDSTTLSLLPVIKDYYAGNNYQRIWSSQENFLPLADSLIQFIDHAREYGLFPEDYHNYTLQSFSKRFALDSTATGDRRDATLWSKADLMLTDAFFLIASHLHKGRLGVDSIYMNPDSTLTDSFYHKNLNDVFKTQSIVEILHSLEPKHSGYQELKNALKRFLDSANFKSNYTYVSYPYKDSVKFVQTLVKRLKEEGAILWQTKIVDSTLLHDAIVKVQKKRNMKVDGKFGVQLIRSLNNSDEEKFKRIAINLDRYKILPQSMPDRYIWVNLPSYTLQLKEDDTVKIESKVIVGNPKTRTPLLTSQISNMVTYPQWTIPNSIILKEILPALKRNPGYLAKKGFMLMRGDGELVDPYTVDWSKYKKGIPYNVVQGSGDANALGILKFNFPNKYAVYLHDTNQRYLFKRDSRALSHGCVRVEQWQKLAYYISSLDSINYSADADRVPSDSIKTWLQRKEKHTVKVKSKIPVYFRYFTNTVKNGRIVFFEDIYNEDKAAREAYFGNKR
jgi:L,D-transpeptidase YcbB